MKKLSHNLIALLSTIAIFLCSFYIFQTSDNSFLAVGETQKKEYTVYFIVDNTKGDELLTQTGQKGRLIKFPDIEPREGYEFLGWIDVEGNPAPTHIPEYDIALYVNWKAIEYTVTIIDENNEPETISFTAKFAKDMRWMLNTYYLPTDSDAYTYTWDKPLPAVFPLQDITYSVVAKPIEYVITFEGVTDLPPITFTVETIKDVTFPPIPQKKGYTGAWNINTEELQLKNTIVTAVYTEIRSDENREKQIIDKLYIVVSFLIAVSIGLGLGLGISMLLKKMKTKS